MKPDSESGSGRVILVPKGRKGVATGFQPVVTDRDVRFFVPKGLKVVATRFSEW